ncbi:hypothetical protein Tco_0972085 [Tanacetum coccineum]
MPILNELITDDIREADYYDAYLEKVAKHQRYLAGEEVSDLDSPTPKPAKSTKPKVTKQAKPVAPKAATKKPQPAPTKPKEKKRKQAKETTEATPPAKRAKAGKVAKKRTLKRSQQLVDEFGMRDAHGAPRGPLPPMVFRETDTGKFQPLPEVEGKGKEKAGAEQAARESVNNRVVLALTSFFCFCMSSAVKATVLLFFFAEPSATILLPTSSGGALIVLSIEDKLNYLEQPLLPAPVASEGQLVAPEITTAHTAWIKRLKEIAGLMLMTMEPEIQ